MVEKKKDQHNKQKQKQIDSDDETNNDEGEVERDNIAVNLKSRLTKDDKIPVTPQPKQQQQQQQKSSTTAMIKVNEKSLKQAVMMIDI